MVKLRTPRKRHLRHGDYDRTGRSKHLRAFTSKRATDLAGTGAAKTFTGTVSAAVAATGLLTFAGQPADTNTVTIGTVTYTFNTVLAVAPNSILIGVDAAATRTNLVSAIMLTAGAGTTYGTGTVVHPTVTAAASGANMTVTAKTAGVAGNTIATTETGANTSFGAATLTGGAAAGTSAVNLTATAHGLVAGAGPLHLTTTGTLPAGLALLRDYWVRTVVNANTVVLTTARADAPAATYTSNGSGTHTMTKASDASAMYDYLKQNDPAVVKNATDVDVL